MTEGAGERPAIATQTLRPRTSSAVWLLLGSLAFVAIGIWMGRDEGWIGYARAAFFALCAVIALISLIPGRDLVGWNYRPGPGTGGPGRRISAALAGCEGALPDTYGMKAAALADHLNRCLSRSRSR